MSKPDTKDTAYERLSKRTRIVDRIMHACIDHGNERDFCREYIAEEIEQLLAAELAVNP